MPKESDQRAAPAAGFETAAGFLAPCGTLVWEAASAPDRRRFVFGSPATVAAFGEPWSRWTDDPQFWLGRLHPDDRDRVSAACDDAQRGRCDLTLEYRMVGTGGSLRWIRDSAHFAGGDQRVQWFGVMADVTALHDTGQALQQQETVFRRALDSVGEIIYLFRMPPGGPERVEFLAGPMESLLGVRADEFENDSTLWESLIHPDDREAVRQQTIEIFRRGRGTREYRMRHRLTFEYRHFQERVTSERNDAGRVVAIFSVGKDVTAQRAQLEHSANARRLGNLIETTSDVFFTLDLEGRYTAINRKYQELSGYTSAELIGRSRLDRLAPESVELARRMFLAKVTGEVSETRCEVTEIAKDGRRFSLDVTSHTVFADGHPVGVQGMARELAESHRAAAALRRSEARRQAVERIARLGTCELAFETREMTCSPEIHRILGLPDESSSTWDTFWSHVHPEDKDTVSHAIEQTRLHGVPFDLEFRLLVRGQVRFIHGLGELAEGEAGPASHMWGSMQDVTDRHLAAQELQRLHSAVNQIDEAIMITDRNGVISYVNPALQWISGYSARTLLGQTPRILRSGQMSEAFYAGLWTTILSGQVWRGVIVNRRADGRLYTEEQTITPVRDERGEITSFIAIGQDITARRELEEQVRQAGKMEAVGRLAGGVAHDFSNLLTIISGYGDVLLAGISEGDRLRRAAVAIKKASERAGGLAQQLLTFSRRQPVAPRPLDLNELVSGMGNLLRRLIGEDIELVTSLSEPLGRVEADTGQLEQVLMNLAANGRDAMPGGGVLTIETSDVSLESGQTRSEPGPYVCLKVTDTGCGMDAETQSHLFEPFYTTKPRGKGTGIGLSIVYGIVEQAGGCTVVNSEVGVGTTLAVYLPRVERPVAAVIETNGNAFMPRGNETILLVEDEDAVRGLLREHLEECGYAVLEARGGAEALAITNWHTEKIHLLATDVVMPQMSGRQLAEKLQAQRPDLKVLYVSGYSDLETLPKDGVAADVALLRKPFNGPEFARKVREILDSAPPA